MTSATDAWRLMWPLGIPVADFDKALDLADLLRQPPTQEAMSTKSAQALALFTEGATLAQVAKALGCTKQAARVRLHRLQAKGHRIEGAEFEPKTGSGRPAQIYRVRR